MRRVLRLLCSIAIVSFAMAGPSTLKAQNPTLPSQETGPDLNEYIFKSTVRRVIVDVAVTDSSGRPAKGLTRDKFSVSEDGSSQEILSFDEHHMDTSSLLSPANLPANTFLNLPTEAERGPLYVLLYDMANTRPDDQIFARQQLLKFIESKEPGTRFAVFASTDGLHLIQGFTADKALLLAALDPSGKRRHMPRIFLYGSEYEEEGNGAYTLWMLREIARFLEGLPGRKNLIWVSDAFPVCQFAPCEQLYIDDTNRVLAALAGQQIAIYTAGAWGLGTSFLAEEIARKTGGSELYDGNDLASALAEGISNAAFYYTLSYSPTRRDYTGELRRIEIKLAEKGYQLSYRREYFATEETSVAAQAESPSKPLFSRKQPAAQPPPDTLHNYMQHGMPMNHDLVFVAHVSAAGQPHVATADQMADLSTEPAYFRKRHKDRPLTPLPPVPLQTYLVDYSVPAQQFGNPQSANSDSQDTLEFVAGAFNDEGLMLNGTIDHATSTRKGAAGKYMAQQLFMVPPGAAWMRLAVRDVSTGRLGCLEITLPLAEEPKTSKSSSSE